MIYLNTFNSHASYEEKLNVGGVDFKIPNVSYCKDANDVHFNPYNLIEFYVGEITGTTPQTVNIFTDDINSIPIQVSKGNKWYSYVLPKNKKLCLISGDSVKVKKVVVKADIYTTNSFIIPNSVVEASFKGSNTSNVTNMNDMFYTCNSLTSLDLSGFDTSKVTNMDGMFSECSSLKSLDVSGFDTSKVTNMQNMFSNCNSLTSLTLSNFNTSNVTNMQNMFYGCSNLAELDLSGFDTSKVTNMQNMFKGYSAPSKKIRMVGCTKETVDKIKEQLTKDNITGVTFVTE